MFAALTVRVTLISNVFWKREIREIDVSRKFHEIKDVHFAQNNIIWIVKAGFH